MKQDSSLEALTQCPLCSSLEFKPFIKCVDHTVSHEIFLIVECKTCAFKFTNPRPSISSIGKYYQSSDYISHSNTSIGIINKIYQIARHFTISKKVKLIKSLSSGGKNILDYGSGTGEFLTAMKKAGWNTKGIEPGEQARSFAINNHLDVVHPDEMKNFFPAKLDIITLWHVLEHIHDVNETIAALRELLTQEGKIIVAVPNNKSTDQKIYKEVWAAYDVPRHLYHFNLESVNRLFQKHQMTVKKVLPMPLDGFYVSFLSEKYKKSNFGLIKGFFSGLKTYLNSLKEKQFSSSLIFIIEKL